MPYIVFVAAPPLDQLRYMHEYGRHQGLGASRYQTVGFPLIFSQQIILSFIFIYSLTERWAATPHVGSEPFKVWPLFMKTKTFR